MTKQTDLTRIENAARRRRIIGSVLIYTLLSIWAVMVLFPFYWMVLSSIKSYGSYNAEYVPKFYASSPTAENYISAFTTVPLGKYLVNTVIFTVITTALMLVVIVLAAFAMVSAAVLRPMYLESS